MNMKKRYLLLAILFTLLTGLLFAWDGFNYVIATEHNAGIRIDWQVKDESNVSYYEIYRSRSDSQILTKLKSVTALGAGASYSYLDDDMFSKSSVSGDYNFDYFIRAVMVNGEYKNSDKVQASLTSLGVSQQTWGSIKAMFR